MDSIESAGFSEEARRISIRMDALRACTDVRYSAAGVRVLPYPIRGGCRPLSQRYVVFKPWWYPAGFAVYPSGIGCSISGSPARGQGPKLGRRDSAEVFAHTDSWLCMPYAFARVFGRNGGWIFHLFSVLGQASRGPRAGLLGIFRDILASE